MDLHHPPSSLTFSNLKKARQHKISPVSQCGSKRLERDNDSSSSLTSWLDTYYTVGANVTIAGYLDFCHYTAERCGDDIKEELNKFCREKYINNCHLFGTDLVVNCLLNDYHFPCGIVATLQDNVDWFTRHLQSGYAGASAFGDEDGGDEEDPDEESEDE